MQLTASSGPILSNLARRGGGSPIPSLTFGWMALLTVAPALQGQAGVPESGAIRQSKLRAAELIGDSDAPFLLIPEYSTVKVMPDRAAFRGMPGEPLEIALARGEREAAQLIVAPIDQDLLGVNFEVSELVGPGGEVFPETDVDLQVMGYVRTDSTIDMSYPADRRGWFPDPILPFVDRFDVELDRVQSLWLTLRAPADQPPGYYTGEVRVSPENAEARAIPVRVRVFDFELPPQRALPTAVALFPEHLEKIYGAAWNDSLWWRYAEFLSSNRLDMDNPYREEEATPSVQRIRRLVALGQRRWSLYYVRQPGEGWSSVGPDASEYDDYIDRVVDEARLRLSILEEAGARDLAYLYLYDEVREQHWDKLRETAARFRTELPGVPILTSAFDASLGVDSGLDDVIDEWVQIIAHFNRPREKAQIDRARASGKRVHWYTTIWPPRPYPNFFIEYDAIEARLLMGALTQKYRPDGFGYWAISFWFATEGQQLLTRGPYTDWNPLTFGSANGEGGWIYAGEQGPITSIRFENFRDGLEDFEYYRQLELAIAGAEGRGVPEAQMEAARRLLAVPPYVARSLTDFTREPEALAHHRLQVAEAIERLNR